MNEREKIIQLWFEMWLTKQDLGIDNIFTEDVIYTESYKISQNTDHISKYAAFKWFYNKSDCGATAAGKHDGYSGDAG